MNYTEYQRQWRRDNKDRVRAYNKRWKAAHPDYFSDRRKRQAEAEVDHMLDFSLPIITDTDILSGAKKVQDGIYDGVCHACGAYIFAGATPAIDYEKKAKKIRGVICKRCKSVLRSVKRSPAVLGAIKAYLEKELGDKLCSTPALELDNV